MKKLMVLFFAVMAFAPLAQALEKNIVGDYDNYNTLVVLCDGREVDVAKHDDDIMIYRVSTEFTIKYEVYSKDNGQMIMACDNIALN